MRVLLAPDKFRGSLTAAAVADALAHGITAVHPDWQVERVPIADGGDGTVAAAVAAGWRRVPVGATDAVGNPTTAEYAVRDDVAVIELADVVGLGKLAHPDPMHASTYGLGQVVSDALDAGIGTVILGLGGSASTDGGAGMLQALGALITDEQGRPIPPGGGGLLTARRIDLRRLRARCAQARFELACDVDNPLLGPRGAAAVFAPQKGADPRQVALLEAALQHWADLVHEATGRELRDAAGAGAAGGAGLAGMAVLGATARPGIEVVFEVVGFRDWLLAADLVVTGEGSLDTQTLAGKAPLGVARAAGAARVPVVAVAGRNSLTPNILRQHGFQACYALADREPDPARSMTDAAGLLVEIGARIAQDAARWLR